MTFDAEKFALGMIGWAEEFFTSQTQKVNLEAAQAIVELCGEGRVWLSSPANKARLAKIGRAAAQDLPSLTAPPAETPAASEPPEIQDGVRGGARGGLMTPGR